MISLPLLENINLQIKTEGNTRKIWDIIRLKWIVLSPEEYVRQALIHYFVNIMHYPTGLISVEKQVKLGTLNKRYDIVIFDRNHKPWMLVECKAPENVINQNTLHQLLQYNSKIPCPFWLLSNGLQSFCAKVGAEIHWLNDLPVYQ
jgi:hypothetical protein